MVRAKRGVFGTTVSLMPWKSGDKFKATSALTYTPADYSFNPETL